VFFQVCREAGPAEEDEIFLSLPFAPVHQLRLLFQFIQDVHADRVDAPLGFCENNGLFIFGQSYDIDFAISAPPAPYPVALDTLRQSFADPGAADLLEGPRDEPVDGRHDLPVQNIIDLPLFDEISVGIDIMEPEAEKMSTATWNCTKTGGLKMGAAGLYFLQNNGT
jgi:hypothetical protein